MKSLLFIGHSYHSLTQSSRFFKDVLKRSYTLEDLTIDPDNKASDAASQLANIDYKDYAGIILWQIDYLASFFLDRGIPVIVCPMYDSSSTLKSNHWLAIKKALVICFSLELQYILAKAGVDALFIRYFPSPTRNTNLITARSGQHHSKPLKVFFWERLPESDINLRRVIKLLSGLNVSSLHVHQAPDPGRMPSEIPSSNSTAIKITTSTWFKEKQDYLDLLSQSDIYIAPRYAEGIGLSFLEAMAHGCCIIAHDMPTHNEYINNWINGILVDYTDPSMVIAASNEAIREVGRVALKHADLHAENWNDFYQPLMLDMIEEYLNGFNPVSSIHFDDPAAALLELQALCAAHTDWSTYYQHINALCHNQETSCSLNEEIMPIVNRLASYGRFEDALQIINAVIAQDQATNNIYLLIKNQLIDRMRLKDGHHS